MDGDILGLVQAFGIGGVLVWYLYYNTSVAMPKLHDKYTDSMAAMAKEFTAALKEEREASAREFQLFRDQSKEARCFYREKVN